MKKVANNIHQKLDALEAPLNKERLWASIHQHPDFPKKEAGRKRRRFILFGWFGGILLSASLLAYFYLMTEPNLESFYIDTRTELHADQSERLSGMELSVHPDISVPDHSSETKQNLPLSPSSTTSKKVPLLAHSENRITKPSTTKHLSISPAEQNNLSIPPLPPAEKVAATTSKTNAANTSIAASALSTDATPGNSKIASLSNLAAKAIPPLSVPPEILNLNILRLEEKLATSPKPWTLALSLGAGYAFHQLQDQDPASTDDIKNLAFRKTNTSTLESYFLNVESARNFRNNWILSLGIQYAVHYQNFQHTYTDIQYDRIVNDNSVGYEKTAQITTHNHFQQYRLLDGQLALGKKIQFAKFNLTLAAGIGWTGFLQVKGKTLDSNKRTSSLAGQQVYQRPTNPYYFGQLMVARPLSHQLDLRFGMTVHSKTRLTPKTAAFQHTLLPVYGKIGLAYHF